MAKRHDPVVQLRMELDGNQVFQRYIGRSAAAGRELEIGELTKIHRGFVTGLDRDWIQVTMSSDARNVLVHIRNITSVEETGRDTSHLSPDIREAVAQHRRLFERIATREVEKLGN